MTEGNIKAHRRFREQLQEVAPMPWRIHDGGYVVDANGMAILGTMVMGDEARMRIIGAVVCGVATCGGYRLNEEMEPVDILE